LRNNKNTFSAGNLGKPSQAEGGSVLGNIAMTVGDLAIEKGKPFLAKKGLVLDVIMRVKLCETPICKRKQSIIR